MATSRRLSNGRSPLVNQQKQITSFFTKSSSSPSPSKLPSKQIPKSQPNPIPKRSPSPSPTTPSPFQSKHKKPLLVIGSSPISPSTLATAKKSHGQEAVNRRVRVYWPLDQSWYEGCVKSFDKISGKHLVQYDDAEEELLDLSKEKIELVEEEVKGRFRRLRRVSVIKDEGEEEFAANVESGGDDVDSADEDWGKNVEMEEAEVGEEGTDLEEEDGDDEDQGGSVKRKQGKDSESRKRKITGGGNSGYSKKRKSNGDPKKSIFKVSLDGNGGKVVEPKVNGSKSWTPRGFFFLLLLLFFLFFMFGCACKCLFSSLES